MSGNGAAGMRVLPGDTLIVERARDYLAGGPAGALELVSRVFGIGNVSPTTAELLVEQRLAPYPDFRRDGDGRWWLTWLHEAAQARGAVPPASTPAASTPLLSLLSYAVVDVETTGGRAEGGDRITEFAAVFVEKGEVIGEHYETLVNPQCKIPSWITKLTNISNEMVAREPVFRDVWPEIRAQLAGRIFVAHNASFDWRFVTAEAARATGERLEGRTLCTVRLARRLLPQLPRRSLDNVARYYGVEIGARHRAAGDAIATAHVLVRLLRDLADRGCTTWEELDRLLAPSTARPRRRRRPPGMPGFSNGEEGA